MAKKTTISQVADIPAIEKQVSEIIAMLERLRGVIKETGDALANIFKEVKGAKNLEDIANAAKKVEAEKKKLTAAEREEQRLQQQQESLLAKLNALENQHAKEVENTRQRLNQRTREIRNQVREEQAQATSLNQMRARLIDLKNTYDNLTKSERKSPFGRETRKELRALDVEIRKIESDTGRMQRNVGNYASAFKGFAVNLLGAAGVTVGLRGLFNVLSGGIKTIRDFEKQNAVLASIFDKSRNDIKVLTLNAKELGAATEYTASQVAGLQIELARLGFNESQIIKLTKPILQFATALDADLSQAAALAGSTLRAFGLQAEDTDRVLAVMTVGANKSALSFDYLNNAMSTIAPVAKAFGFGIEDTVALLGTLADAGFDASMAATATRNILLNLADANGKLAKTLGRPVKNTYELVDALKELRARGVSLNETLELTDKRSVAAFNRFLDGAESMQKLRGELENTEGILDRLQREQLNTLDGSVKLLASAWEGLMLSFSNSSGIFRVVVDWLTDVITGINTLIDRANAMKALNAGLIPEQWLAEINADVESRMKNYIDAVTQLPEYATKSMEEITAEAATVTINNLDKEIAIAKDKLKELGDVVANAAASSSFGGNAFLDMLGVGFSYDNVAKAQEEYNQQLASIKILEQKVQVAKDYTQEVTTQVERTGAGLVLDDKRLAKLKKEALEILKIQSEIKAAEAAFEADQKKAVADDVTFEFASRYKALQDYELIKQAEINRQLEADIEYTNQSIDNATLRTLKIQQLEQKANIDRVNLHNTTVKAIEKLDSEYFTKFQTNLENRLAEELHALTISEQTQIKNTARLYRLGVLSTEQYNEEVGKIRYNNELAALDAQINFLETELLAVATTEKDKEAIREKFRKLRRQRDELVANQETQDEIDRANKARDQREKNIQYVSQFASEIFTFSNAIIDNIFSKRLAQIDKEIEQIDTLTQKRIKSIQASGDTEIEKTAQIALVEEQAANKKEQLEEKKAQLSIRQAKLQKALAASQVIASTAEAIMRTYGQAGYILGIPLAAVMAAIGAVQLATVLASPIPQYAEGTSNHLGGAAIVGDGGKREIIITPNNRTLITPDTPTLVDMPKGSIVLPDADDAIAKLSYEDAIPYYGVKMSSDIARLEDTFTTGVTRIEQALEDYQSSVLFGLDRDALITAMVKQNKQSKYVSKLLRRKR